VLKKVITMLWCLLPVCVGRQSGWCCSSIVNTTSLSDQHLS